MCAGSAIELVNCVGFVAFVMGNVLYVSDCMKVLSELSASIARACIAMGETGLGQRDKQRHTQI